MDIVREKMMTDKTLNDDPETILKPCVEETVGNSDLTTFVEKTTEVSVVQGGGSEVTGNEIEGLFGNLGGEDEGSKVSYSENGTSVGMASFAGEINAIFEGENLNAVFQDKAGSNEHADPMDIFEFKEDMNMDNNNEERVGEDNGDEELQAEIEDHDFVVGDFVWGKIKSHPWWPGQIYDPTDTSHYASNLKREGQQLLVAYFGDRSFSWCSPSQVKPFINNFEIMSRQSDSKKFVCAVQNCLEEVSRRLEAELMRKCPTVNVNENAGVVNRGIKEGARAPKGNTVKVLVDGIKPVELVSTLKGYATTEPGARRADLELVVLKGCLRAFYTEKGGFLLVDYHEPMCIEGLEEETRSGVVADSDVNGLMRSPENGDDKLYQKRKQKSVAELMGEDESKIKKVKVTKDGGTKEKKMKDLMVSVTPVSDYESGGGVEEEMISPRQRKKSRYLSPPYLSPIGIGSGKFSVLGSGSFKEPKPEAEKVSELGAEQVEDGLKKSSGKKAREKRRVREGSDPQEHKKNMDADVSVAKVLDGLLCAALDASSCVQKENMLPTIMEVVVSFRSSIFKEGSSNQTGKKKRPFKHTGKKKDGEDKLTGKKKDAEDRHTSELGFIKQKLEWMSEMVQKCEMNADVKGRLQGGLQEVLGKVVKMRGK